MRATANLAALDAAMIFTPGAGSFNLAVGGTFVATVVAEKSFDGGPWLPVMADAYGTPASFTTPGVYIAEEADAAAQWRLRVSAYTSGTVAARVSA